MLGSGGRENALAWKLAQSRLLAGAQDRFYAAPGNPGIAEYAETIRLDATDHAAVIAFCKDNGIGLVVVGPEAPLVDAWDTKALLYDYADQDIARFAVDERITAGSVHAWGGLDWQALAAPGHDMGALVFFNPEHRVLISGDALWENGFGFVMPRAIDPGAMPAARATLDMIASLDARALCASPTGIGWRVLGS